MTSIRVSFALVFCSFLGSLVSAFGQTTDSAATANQGVASEWDARKLIDAFSAQAEHLKPLLDQVQPSGWASKGASETYVAQWNTTEAQIKYLISSSEAFSRQPERLPLGLDTYFRMVAVESTLGSLTEGVRKYQNPALASIMQEVIAETSTNRDRLRQYLQDLATQKEQEFEVADREAQRCRASLLRQPAPNKAKKVSP